MRIPLVLAALLLSVLPPAHARAASPAGLTISVPATGGLGTTTTGAGSLSGVLGAVTVSTSPSLGTGGWTATVVASSFTTGGGTAAETIPASAVSYRSGAATAATGVAAGLCAPGQLTTSVSIGSAQTAFSCGGISLLTGTSVTWRPTITITLPPAAVAGTYTGTITHSVV